MQTKLSVYRGDITQLAVGAIVNAANQRMLGGGGVDGAIHRSAGPGLLEECKTVPVNDLGERCPTGEARITGGYLLPAKYVIHTVGPIYSPNANELCAVKLHDCYDESLKLAKENGVRTIAFPCISTGVYGYPKDRAAAIAVTTTKQFISRNPGAFDEVIFVVFSDEAGETYERLLQ